MNIKKEIDNLYDELVQIRRHLHKYPDLSENEAETAEYICGILDKWDIAYTSHIAGNGICATIGTPKEGKRCVGLSADIDALPVTEQTGLPYASERSGIMHACGHDMHTTILIGCAGILKKHEDTLDGCVKLLFRPAEETIGGAGPMIEAGCLENPKVDYMLSLHVDPQTPTGSVTLKYGPANAATNEFFMDVTGKSCHGAHPDEGIDAIVMASQIVLALQTISSRFTAPTTPVVVTIGEIHGGSQSNIVSGSMRLSGTIRALNSDTMNHAQALVEQIAGGIATSFGGTVSIQWDENPFPPLINSNKVTAVLERTAREALGDEHVIINDVASLGADDFAFFSEVVEGSYFNIGVKTPGKECAPLHSEFFAPDESAMKTGVDLLLSTTCKLFAE